MIASTFFFCLLILFSSLYTIGCNDIDEKDYFNCIHAVVRHFRVQEGWSSISHIEMVDENLTTTFTTTQVLQDELLDEISVINLYNKIAEVVNWRYVEIIKTFFLRLTIVTNECNYLKKKKAYGRVVRCIITLQNILNYSWPLFENLYAAETFLSSIDVKIVSLDYTNYSDYIVDELYDVRNFVSSIGIVDNSTYTDDDGNTNIYKALEDLNSIIIFIESITGKLNNIRSQNSRIIIPSTTEINYKKIYKDDQSNENSDFVSYMFANLTTFIAGALENDFANLGFFELINPTSPNLIPPHETNISQNNRIRVLNVLFQARGWENMNHIRFLYNDHTINANRVVRDIVTNYNYHLKKEHFLALLRCRYFEILHNCYTILNTMLSDCKNMRPYEEQRQYCHCVVKFSNLIYETIPMLRLLSRATDKLRDLSFWKEESRFHTSLSPIINIIFKFLFVISNTAGFVNFGPNDHSPNVVRIVNYYVESFEERLKKINVHVLREMQGWNNRCIYNEGLLNEYILNSFSTVTHDASYPSLFEYFENFCQNVIANDYNGIGFDQLPE